MVKRVSKSSDGMYHIKGKKFQLLKGSRAQVWHGTAYKTEGNLTKDKLKMNKHKRIVSKAKSSKGNQMLKRLTSKGYHTKKGTFGYVKKTAKKSRKSKRRRR